MDIVNYSKEIENNLKIKLFEWADRAINSESYPKLFVVAGVALADGVLTVVGYVAAAAEVLIRGLGDILASCIPNTNASLMEGIVQFVIPAAGYVVASSFPVFTVGCALTAIALRTGYIAYNMLCDDEFCDIHYKELKDLSISYACRA
jgi:hypothetical protein